jgi:hypothetical protein
MSSQFAREGLVNSRSIFYRPANAALNDHKIFLFSSLREYSIIALEMCSLIEGFPSSLYRELLARISSRASRFSEFTWKIILLGNMENPFNKRILTS